MALINSAKEMEKVLDRVMKKYDVALYIIKDKPFYRNRWNILTCGMGNHISWGRTLDELFYNLMYRIAYEYSEEEYQNTEACMIHFALKNKLI